MFGFLRGPAGDPDYRRAYARCCRHQRLAFGFRSAAALSYEGVFLYLLLREAKGLPPLPGDEPLCCRLRGARKLVGADDAEIGRGVSAFGLLLASIKLEDDVRDDQSLAARLGLSALSQPIREARAWFEETSPASTGRFDAIVAEHLALERAQQRVSLQEFAAATAEGFAQAFGAVAESDDRAAPVASAVSEVGRLLGAAIVTADCAFDWRRDQHRGAPNPIRGDRSAQAALTSAQRSLSAACGALGRLANGPSTAGRTLLAAIDRLETAKHRLPSRTPSPRSTWASRVRRQRARAGDCDCPCEAGDCLPDDTMCCECLNCWPGRWGCCFPNSDRSRATKTNEKAIRAGGSFVGRHGYANGALDPTGLVVINGRSHAARSGDGRIAGGARVVVVEDGDRGLVVEAAEGDA